MVRTEYTPQALSKAAASNTSRRLRMDQLISAAITVRGSRLAVEKVPGECQIKRKAAKNPACK